MSEEEAGVLNAQSIEANALAESHIFVQRLSDAGGSLLVEFDYSFYMANKNRPIRDAMVEWLTHSRINKRHKNKKRL